MIPLSTYLKQYKVGDIVDVVANGTNPRRAQLRAHTHSHRCRPEGYALQGLPR
jgi:ribosomal protein L21E